jgi:tRNA(Ile)-lysidine synthase
MVLKVKTFKAMIVDKVIQTIKKYHMLSPGEHIIAGVSGGADSVALLSILCSLRDQWRLTISVAHLNHLLREEAAQQEALFVADLAERLGLPCIAEEHDVRAYRQREGLSLQEAARTVRYKFFLDLRQRIGARKVALGHTASDQAETLLMWLIRGTSAAGLAGIPPVRDDIFVRPLINITRAEIESYLNEQHITYIPDSSASEQHYLRNKIRHQLIPLLQQEYNPNMVNTLNRLGELLQQDNEILDAMVREGVADIVPAGEGNELIFPVKGIQKYPEALQGRIIKAVIARIKKSSQGIYFTHIEAVRQLISSTGPSRKIQLPAGWSVVREYDMLIFTQEKFQKSSFCYTFDCLPERISIQELRKAIIFKLEEMHYPGDNLFAPEKNIDYLDYDRLKFPLTVRNYQPGDRFYPLGLGGSKKLKDFFIDNKISPRERYSIPLVLFQDKIAWVGGLRIDDRFRITPGTRNALKIQLISET